MADANHMGPLSPVMHYDFAASDVAIIKGVQHPKHGTTVGASANGLSASPVGST
jgi:hypothetical protein